jgi:hypothetical protein
MNDSMLPVVKVGDLDDQVDTEPWLIEGLWGRDAIGLVGGPPKSTKSWFGLDMALSVASGTAALGHFPTRDRAAALVYLAEDALPQVRARVEALCRHRRLDIHALDLHVITAPVLRLDLKTDQLRLAHTIAAIKPRLMVLDPLVRMHRLDENSAAEISGLLGYIRELQRRFHVAIVLVHHASKKQRSQPGQALRGSSDLHAIGDSNAYLTRDKDANIILTIEHRAAPCPEPMTLELVCDSENQATHLRVCGQSSPPARNAGPSLAEQVLELLAGQSGPLSRTAIRDQLRVNNERLGTTLNQLEQQGQIRRCHNGWQRLPC